MKVEVGVHDVRSRFTLRLKIIHSISDLIDDTLLGFTVYSRLSAGGLSALVFYHETTKTADGLFGAKVNVKNYVTMCTHTYMFSL